MKRVLSILIALSQTMCTFNLSRAIDPAQDSGQDLTRSLDCGEFPRWIFEEGEWNGRDENAEIKLNELEISAGESLSFDYKITSDEGEEFLDFYVDGVLEERFTGQQEEYTQFMYAIPDDNVNATHNFLWRISKAKNTIFYNFKIKNVHKLGYGKISEIGDPFTLDDNGYFSYEKETYIPGEYFWLARQVSLSKGDKLIFDIQRKKGGQDYILCLNEREYTRLENIITVEEDGTYDLKIYLPGSLYLDEVFQIRNIYLIQKSDATDYTYKLVNGFGYSEGDNLCICEKAKLSKVRMARGQKISFGCRWESITGEEYLNFYVNGKPFIEMCGDTEDLKSYSWIALDDGKYSFKWEFRDVNDEVLDKNTLMWIKDVKVEEADISNIFIDQLSNWNFENNEYISGKNDESSMFADVHLHEGDEITFEYKIEGDEESGPQLEVLANDDYLFQAYEVTDSWEQATIKIEKKSDPCRLEFEYAYCVSDEGNPKVRVRNIGIKRSENVEINSGHWTVTNPDAGYVVNEDIAVKFSLDKRFQNISKVKAEPIEYSDVRENILPNLPVWPAVESLSSVDLYAEDLDGNKIELPDEVDVSLRLSGNEFTDEDVQAISKYLTVWYEGQVVPSKVENGTINFKTNKLGVFTVTVSANRHIDTEGTDIRVGAEDSGDCVWFEAEEGVFMDSIVFYADTVMESEKEEFQRLLEGLDIDKDQIENIIIHHINAHDGLNHQIKKFNGYFDIYIERPEGFEPDSKVVYINENGEDQYFDTDLYYDENDGKTYLHIRTNHLSPHAIIDPDEDYEKEPQPSANNPAEPEPQTSANNPAEQQSNEQEKGEGSKQSQLVEDKTTSVQDNKKSTDNEVTDELDDDEVVNEEPLDDEELIFDLDDESDEQPICKETPSTGESSELCIICLVSLMVSSLWILGFVFSRKSKNNIW